MDVFTSLSRMNSTIRSSQMLRAVLTAFEATADFATAVFAINLSYLLHVWHSTGKLHFVRPPADAERIAVFFGFLIILLLKKDGAYRGSGSLLKIRETERALRTSLQACCVVIPMSLLLGVRITRPVVGFSLLCLPLCQAFQKQCVLRATKWLHTRGVGVQRAVVYGAGATGRRMLSAIWSSPKLGWRPVLVVDDNPELSGSRMFGLGYRRSELGVIEPGPITESLLVQNACDLLIIAVPSLPPHKLEKVLLAAQAAQTRVAVLSNASMSMDSSMESVDVDGLFLISVGSNPSNWVYDLVKRLFDLLLASILLIMLSPLFLLIAILIPMDSAGGCFFKQDRIGRYGQVFKILKFRSMYSHVSSYEISPSTPMDARITRVGKFLRKTSLDELPQLINVFTGDMSLVGPRPEMPFLVAKYTSFQRQRLQVVPGLTGLWQLSADRAFHIHENIQYDMYYIRHRGFFMDLAILLHTLFFAVRGI